MGHSHIITSLNVRGLREHKKRSNLFFWLRKKQFDITLIQETYWTEELTTKLQKEWEGKILLNSGTQHSKGTAILFKGNLNCEILNVHKSDDSRIILTNIKLEDKTITLINIYAPNQISERKTFFNKVQKWINKFSLNDQEIILGGDFNHTEINYLDRRVPASQSTNDASTVTYKALLAKYDLHDIWREMHPDKKSYTYRECSRLDKFVVSNNVLDYVQKSNILPAGIKSDHKCITLNVDLNNSNRGPGRWKLNTRVLNDKLYHERIKALLTKTKTDYQSYSKQMIWEICKIKIKEYTISYCKYKQKLKKDLMKEIEKKIDLKELELIQSNYSHKIQLQKDTLTNDLHSLVHEQNLGLQIRSRARWIEEGEKSTKYFYSLEKQHITTNNIKLLKKDDGSYTKSESEILEEQHHYYEKLYKKDDITENCIKNYLKNTKITHTLNENEKNTLEGEITEYECKEAINAMKLNKSPGSDGISVEFYKAFWEDIKFILIESLNSAYHLEKMSTTQRRGILSLLYKKNDKTLLTNWRPISLLNTDYKILTHVLANRLKKVLNKLINADQTGYLKGRNIGQNIRLIQDVIDYCENNETEGAIVFLDFQKAFDTVNHSFLDNVLKKFNFGESFIKWVRTIYNDAESCVSNNGWTSKPFQIQRGIRQGCPLSALLFLLVVEILAENIRTDKSDGLKIKCNGSNKHIQISQLADDTTLFLKDEQAITNCLNKVELFGKVSGLKLNKNKTEGLWLGVNENRKDQFAGISWEQNYVKALGVYFGYDKQDLETRNWNAKLESIKKILNRWKYRDLTFQGRVLIVKTVALSKIVYLVSSICTPSWVINELNKEFFAFVWKYKRDKIARKVMISEIEQGGLNMLDFRSFCIAMKTVWAYRLYKSKGETWSILPNKYMENCDITMLLCMNIDHERQLPVKLPQFYKEVILGWHSCGGGRKAPQNAEDIRKEPLWGNKFLQTKGKTLYYKHWKDSNINFIDDIITNNGGFRTGEEIFAKLKQKTNWLIEYKLLIKTIPKLWKEKLIGCNMSIKVKKVLKPFLLVKNKQIYNLPVKAKGYYQLLIDKIKHKSFNEKYWDNIFSEKPPWNVIWSSRVKKQEVKKLADFHFKLLHRILPSQENLYKWKLLNSNNCRFGCPCLETYYHMFVSCPRLANVFNKVENILKSQGICLKISYKILILGYKLSYSAYKDINTLLSQIFYAIYKYWIHDDSAVNINKWILCQLKLWLQIYKEKNDRSITNLLDKFLQQW